MKKGLKMKINKYCLRIKSSYLLGVSSSAVYTTQDKNKALLFGYMDDVLKYKKNLYKKFNLLYSYDDLEIVSL